MAGTLYSERGADLAVDALYSSLQDCQVNAPMLY